MKCRKVCLTLGVVLLSVAGTARSAMAPCDLPASEPSLIFGTSLESEVMRDGDCFNISGNAPTRMQERSRSGGYAMRSYLNRYKSPVSYRTEVRVRHEPTVVGKEYWYGFSIYLPAPYTPDDDAGETLAQWHATKDANDESNNPPLALQVLDGQWRLWTRWSSSQPTSKDSVRGASLDLGPQKTDRWTDWVFRVKWSSGSDGYLQVWKDGAKVVDRTGPNAYNDEVGPFFKMGIYKTKWRNAETVSAIEERLVYHDEFRMAGPGASYSDVAPGQGREAPIPIPKPPMQVVVQ